MIHTIDNTEADRFAQIVFERIEADPHQALSGSMTWTVDGEFATIRWDGIATMPTDEFLAMFNAAQIRATPA